MADFVLGETVPAMVSTMVSVWFQYLASFLVSVSVSVGGFSVWFQGVVSGSGSGLVSGSASVYLDCRGKPLLCRRFARTLLRAMDHTRPPPCSLQALV